MFGRMMLLTISAAAVVVPKSFETDLDGWSLLNDGVGDTTAAIAQRVVMSSPAAYDGTHAIKLQAGFNSEEGDVYPGLQKVISGSGVLTCYVYSTGDAIAALTIPSTSARVETTLTGAWELLLIAVTAGQTVVIDAGGTSPVYIDYIAEP